MKKMRMMGVAILAAIFLSGCDETNEFVGYAKRSTGETKALAAFDNPEFEDVTKYGKVNDNAEIGRFGYNGNGGIRIRPFGKKLSHRFPCKVKLEKGKRYVFYADVRKHGDVSCQIACDVKFTATGRYASGYGAWGPATRAIGDGWSHMELTFVAKDEPEHLDYTFMLYSFVANKGDVKDTENYIDLDNLGMREDLPKWYFCNTWPTHNRIHAEEGRVRCHSWFFGDFLEQDGEAVYELTLIKPDGTLLARDVVTPDENGIMTAVFKNRDYLGPVKLASTLYDRTRKLELGTKTLDLTIEKTPDMRKGLFVKENGVVLKDGKPYMPLGFYSGLADKSKYTKAQVEEHLKNMRDAGFNVMMDYSTYLLNTKQEREWYYGLCAKYGIDVLNDDFKFTSFPKDFDANLPKHRARAAEVTKYPAVIGFYIMDEGSEAFVAPLTKVRRMLNEVAPDKIVNVCNIMRPAPYLPIADIQGGDDYPVKNTPDGSLAGCHERVTAMRKCGPAAIWWAPQAYNWASMVRGALDNAELYKKSGREPTENEMLAVALLNASDGVTGFFFYSHFDIFRCPVKEWIPQRWKNICNVGTVIKGLEPFILSGEKIVALPHTDTKGEVRIAALTDGNGHYRVIVVGLARDHETTFTLPAEYGALKGTTGYTTCENGTYTFRAKEYSCDLLK
ncbi:MAG: hypothetical protein PHV28_17815 [Kiritimatiellae bacterium]|nr:hypothetical protein [Kiritimatiellia bacterium]